MNILNHKHVKIRNIRHHPTLTDFNSLFTIGFELDYRYYLIRIIRFELMQTDLLQVM